MVDAIVSPVRSQLTISLTFKFGVTILIICSILPVLLLIMLYCAQKSTGKLLNIVVFLMG